MSTSSFDVRMSALEEALDAADTLAPADLMRLVSLAARCYAANCERADRELPPVTAAISTTEAVRLSVALARSQGLSAFDLALWFAQMRPADPAATIGNGG